jgi:Xaa-Pro aminopeptidase
MRHLILAFALTSTATLVMPPVAGGQSQTPGAAAAPEQGRIISGATQRILPERERPAVINRVLRERLETLLPAVMRETGFDMWLVINREYVEDPVYLTLVPEPVFHARRLSMLVFFDRGPEKGVERLTVSRYPITGFYTAAWNGGTAAEQWKRLAEIVAERNPKKIGINTSREWSFGDGLSSGLHASLMEALGPTLAPRVASADKLCVRWLETRTRLELDLLAHAVSIARGVVSEAFSSRTIAPGVTTTDDVAWYIRQRFTDLGLDTWFVPTVERQFATQTCAANQPFCGASGVIERGDVLHCDVGITYLRLNTDTQEMAYVLRHGEQEAPAGLKKALAIGNRWQDLLTTSFATGRTGDEVFAKTAAAAKQEGIVHSTYSHPVGFHGHAAGPAIGMWDNQGPVPVTGAWPIAPNTAYAIEGNIKAPVPEWNGASVQIAFEQTAFFDGTRVIYAAGRQTEWHLVR